MIGVEDLALSKKFYGEGLGCTIDQDHPNFVSFDLGDGSSSLALYEREAAAEDAGVSSEGSGFRGVSFHYIVPSNEAVDEVNGKRRGGRWRRREGSSRGSVGVLRVLQRPGRLSLEGRGLVVGKLSTSLSNPGLRRSRFAARTKHGPFIQALMSLAEAVISEDLIDRASCAV